MSEIIIDENNNKQWQEESNICLFIQKDGRWINEPHLFNDQSCVDGKTYFVNMQGKSDDESELCLSL